MASPPAADMTMLIGLAMAALCVLLLVRWIRSWPLQGAARKVYALFLAGGAAMVGALLYALGDGAWGLGITVFVISLAVTPLVFTVGVIAWIMRSTRQRPDGPLLMSIAVLSAVLTYALD